MIAAITILVSLLSSIFIGAIVGAFTRFFEFLIGNPWRDEVFRGNILSFYGVWIRKRYDKFEEQNNFTKLNFYKALGVCPYCLNVWFGFIIGGFMLYVLDLQWWLMVGILASSHYTLGYIFDKEGA